MKLLTLFIDIMLFSRPCAVCLYVCTACVALRNPAGGEASVAIQLNDLLAANARYANGFDEGALAMPPAQHLAIVTCMDARLEPLAFLGLRLGDAHVIRNAGGRVSEDALRSLVISE